MMVWDAICPFSKRRLDEAFGLAVGLWTIGAGEAMPEPEALTCCGECFGAERRAVVGEDASRVHAQGSEIGHGVMQELDGTGFALVRV